MKRKLAAHSLLLVAPLVLLAIHLYFVKTVDNGRLTLNIDPDYAYLVSAIDLSKLSQSEMVLHPGTSIQLLAHVAMKGIYFLRHNPGEDFPRAVLKEPVFYLNTLQSVFSLLNVALILGMGIWVYRITARWTSALLFQLTPFFSSQVITFGLRKITADILLISVMWIMAMTLVKFLHSEFSGQNRRRAYLPAIGLGCVSGLAMATKITFLPAAVVPLLVLPGAVFRMIYFLTAVISAFVMTIPIAPQYFRITDFLKKIFTHQELYGYGSESVFNLGKYASNLYQILLDNWPYVLIVAVSVGVIWVNRKSGRNREDAFQRMALKMLTALTASGLLSILVVARHFKSKYLLPSLCLSGLTLYLINRILTSRSGEKRSRWISPVWILFLVFSLVHTAQGVKKFHRQHSDKLRESRAIQKKLKREFKGYQVIYQYGASSVLFGLEFGNQFTPVYRNTLRSLYGDHYFYNVSSGRLYHWREKRKITTGDLIARFGRKLIFFGAPFYRLKQKTKELGIRLRDVFEGDYLTLYQPVEE